MLAGKTDVVVEEDLVDLLRLGSPDDALLRLSSLGLLLGVLVGCGAATVFVLRQKTNEIWLVAVKVLTIAALRCLKGKQESVSEAG